MRVTVAHKKSTQEAMEAADRAIDQIFRGIPNVPLQIVDQNKSWAGQLMKFALTAKVGFVKYPIRGTVEVSTRDYIVEIELGMLGKFLPAGRTRDSIETRVRGLLS